VDVKCGQKFIGYGLKGRDSSTQHTGHGLKGRDISDLNIGHGLKGLDSSTQHTGRGLKGRDISAQGNALGQAHPPTLRRPVRAQHIPHSTCSAHLKCRKKSLHVPPLQGINLLNNSVPRALPWAVMLLPLTGRPNNNHNIVQTGSNRAGTRIASQTFVHQGGQPVRTRAWHGNACRDMGGTLAEAPGSNPATASYRYFEPDEHED